MISWQDIPGNNGAFESCLEILRTGKAVGFVGAGASAGLYPLWPQLIEHLADAAVAGGAPVALKKAWCGQVDPLQAALQLRKRLGEGKFAEEIRRLFGPRKTVHGQRYTSTHSALARLGFRSFVTTNYDPALTFACQSERLGQIVHDFGWRHDRVGLWLQGRPAEDGETVILHAHGQYDDKDSVLLGAEDYRRAYRDDRYRQLFEQLWTREQLVIVGFSFTDAWLRLMADQALSRADTRKVGDARHVALMGLTGDQMEAVEVYRAEIEEPFHLRALFYPVATTVDDNGKTHKNHTALGEVLQALLDATAAPVPSVTTTTVAHPHPPDPLDIWFRQVEAEHRRLGDHFDRPAELHLIEQAWVEVKVLPAHQQPGRNVRGEDAEGGKLLGQPTTLDKVLDWPLGTPSWNEGRWLLEGPPGSGKTTLLRHLAARLARERDPKAVPVFASLSRLIETPNQDLLAHVTDGLGLTTPAPVRDALSAAGHEGRLLLLLDGFDEIPRERRAAARRCLTQLQQDEAWSKCKLVVSSRPIGRGEALEELPRLDLLALDVARRREFLETWFRHAGQPKHGKKEPWTPESEADAALSYLTGTRGLRELSGIPLYLTLLAVLWEQGIQPSGKLAELYAEIFELLLDGKHRRAPRPMANQDAVREALQRLAFGMTEDDCWAEARKKLEGRLRASEEVRHKLAQVDAWRDLFTFLDDVHERTQILGPHDGGHGDWRFWHRTFREALAAEACKRQFETEGTEALLEWARQLQEGGEGRWAEPMALLAGAMEDADDLVVQLAEANPKLAVRAAVFAQGLKPETVRKTLNLTESNLDERAQVFESIPDQLGDPEACLALVEQLRQEERNGFDLFWLWWIAEEAGRRWKVESRVADVLDRFFEHIPAPKDVELFQSVESKLDGRVPLWREIPAGEGWIGSPEDESERYDDEGPRHQVKVVRPFWLGSVPVTNAQYAAFDPGKALDTWEGVEPENLLAHPRINVTWYEAVSFCRWLESLPEFRGCGVRLPEEEEWEYACRAGTQTRFWKGDGEKQLAEVGWYEKNSESRTHQVAGKSANPWGLYDLHGNAWEWALSEWDLERYQGRSPEDVYAVDPAAPAADLAASPRVGRVMRGGSYWLAALWCRSAFRNGYGPWDEWDESGFRVLLSSAPSRP